MKEQIPLNPNYIKYQQSDIFIQKGLSKPEIKYTHKRNIPKNTFDSSYNFLYWKDISPHFDENIKIKVNQNNVSQILHSNAEKYLKKDLNLIGSKLKHKAFYEKMYENEPEKNIDKSKTLNKTLNKRYQKETMFLGNYAGDEYKIKKNKTVIYKPTNDYLKQETPLQTKMDFIYRSSEGIIGNPKSIINHKNKIDCPSSSIGYLKREFETINDRDTKIINDPKKMKYFNIYGNKGIENVNKKLKSMKKSKTTNNFYTPGIDCTKNRINFLKSNIFHDEEIDIKNNEDKNNKYNNKTYKSIKVNRQSQKRKIYKRANSTSKLINKYYNTINNERNNNNININTNNNKTDEDIINIKNNSRKFLYGKNGEDNLPIKLDWRDDKTYLLFPQSKNRDIIKQNPRQKKSLLKSGIVLSLMTFASRIMGLIREMTKASFLGTSMYADAFATAFQIPNLLRRLFAENAISVAFIPTFKDYLEQGNKEGADKELKKKHPKKILIKVERIPNDKEGEESKDEIFFLYPNEETDSLRIKIWKKIERPFMDIQLLYKNNITIENYPKIIHLYNKFQDKEDQFLYLYYKCVEPKLNINIEEYQNMSEARKIFTLFKRIPFIFNPAPCFSNSQTKTKVFLKYKSKYSTFNEIQTDKAYKYYIEYPNKELDLKESMVNYYLKNKDKDDFLYLTIGKA